MVPTSPLLCGLVEVTMEAAWGAGWFNRWARCSWSSWWPSPSMHWLDGRAARGTVA